MSITQCLKRYPLKLLSKCLQLVYVARIDDPYNLRSFGKEFLRDTDLEKMSNRGILGSTIMQECL